MPISVHDATVCKHENNNDVVFPLLYFFYTRRSTRTQPVNAQIRLPRSSLPSRWRHRRSDARQIRNSTENNNTRSVRNPPVVRSLCVHEHTYKHTCNPIISHDSIVTFKCKRTFIKFKKNNTQQSFQFQILSTNKNKVKQYQIIVTHTRD